MDANIPSENKNKVLAGVAYLLLFLSWIGLILDIIIYYSTKNKYAKFHAGQACFLELVIVIIGLVLSFGTAGVMIGLGTPFAGGFSGFYFYIHIFTIIISIIYIGLAIAAFMGKDFRIPIAATLLEK